MSTTEKTEVFGKYSAKWQERFAFFETNGGPGDPRYMPAQKALKFGKKVLINFNFIAWFFGPIYFFVLGLWRKNLAIFGLMFLVYAVLIVLFAVLGMEFPNFLDRGIGIGFAILYARTANYAYYLKEVKGDQGWNPFKV